MVVDVHIIIKKHEPWLDQCLWSLKDEPVAIHLVPYIEGDIAAAREKGFGKGGSEFVSFVDPDDLIMQGIFAKCVEALKRDESLSGVYTNEVLIDERGEFLMNGWAINPDPFVNFGYTDELMNGIHHLRVLRRSFVEKCLPLKTKRMPEPVLMAELKKHGELKHIDQIGYKWRIHDGQCFKTCTNTEKQEAVNIIRGLKRTKQCLG